MTQVDRELFLDIKELPSDLVNITDEISRNKAFPSYTQLL